MDSRIGLYEYLGVPVTGGVGEGTVDTRATGETYDDDPGLDLLGYLSLGTEKTANTTDTYDDQGMEQLAEVVGLTASTSMTHVDAETYDDDPGLEFLGYSEFGASQTAHTAGSRGNRRIGYWTDLVERAVSTSITKVEAETYDDDPGLGGL